MYCTDYESWNQQQINYTKFDSTEIPIMNQNSVKIVVSYFSVLNLDSGESVLHFYSFFSFKTNNELQNMTQSSGLACYNTQPIDFG